MMSITNAGGVFRAKTDGYIVAVVNDSNQAAGDGSHFFIFYSIDTASTSARLSLYGRRTIAGWGCGTRRLDADELASAQAGTASGHNIVTAHGDWGNGLGRVLTNGVEGATVALPAGAGLTSDTDGLAAWLFRNAATGETPADSEIAEIVIVNAAMSASEIASMNAYLKAKWGTP
jgi:hypothetical protein